MKRSVYRIITHNLINLERFCMEESNYISNSRCVKMVDSLKVLVWIFLLDFLTLTAEKIWQAWCSHHETPAVLTGLCRRFISAVFSTSHCLVTGHCWPHGYTLKKRLLLHTGAAQNEGVGPVCVMTNCPQGVKVSTCLIQGASALSHSLIVNDYKNTEQEMEK